MATKLKDYDVAEHLRTPKEMAAYLDACLAECDGDASFVAKALSGVGNPQLDTVLKGAKALGLTLSVRPAA